MKKRVENYIILLSEVLGEGSFGIVYKGYHQKTNEPIAIKVLSKKKIDKNQYVREALRLEIKILHRIQSEYIVRFKDVIETPNNYYIVQQLCNGGNLGTYLNNHKGLNEELALDFMAQILRGFCKLISQGIVHRDMKPENILLHDGRLKIADFGMAKSISGTIFLESSVGTPMYQSPQLISMQKYTYKCDIWALGIIYYYMLYHKHPWKTGVNFMTHLENIRNHQIVFPKEIEVSEQSKKFILKCLAYEEADRADWHQIYTNPLFEGMLPNFASFLDTFNYIVAKLRKLIHQSNIDLKRFFKGQKLHKGSSLRMDEFAKMIYTISKDLGGAEVEYMFIQFDKDRNGKISFEQFEICLKEHQIRMQNKQKQEIKKLFSWNLQDKLDSTIIQQQKKQEKMCIKIRESLQKKEIYDLYELFIQSDVNEAGSLSLQQLRDFLKAIVPDTSKEEAQIMFDRFDENSDQKITFKEFYKGMCSITGIPSYEAACTRRTIP